MRVALANIRYAHSPEESIVLACEAIDDASRAGAALICFPECYVPGYRGLGYEPPPPDAEFLERAWTEIAAAAARAKIAVILGTERVGDGLPRPSALVIDANGTRLGFQDKVQLDPSEDTVYSPASERQLFSCGEMTFGVVICHEGWRYPETVRWAARRGAQVVFHPHFHPGEEGSYAPSSFADPANTFHEKAMFCRAAENTIWFASVNYASKGSGTTSAVVRPDGTLLVHQPYGEHGVLVADIDLSTATRLLASRCRTTS